MADYVLEGPKWGSSGVMAAGGTVTWAIDATVPLNFIPVLDSAFDDWSAYANIQFREVNDFQSAQIDITLGAIDGLGGVLGITSYRFSGATLNSATVELDSGERWHSSGGRIASNAGTDLFVVALHEIGHALGLDHYNAAPAIMNSVITPAVTDLRQSDIDGIRALYGAPVLATTLGLVDIGWHGSAWNVVGVGDFNADGTSDIIWRNPATGSVDQWQMKDGHWLQSIDLGNAKGADWQLAGTGDFNHDSNQDVLWFNTSTGHIDEWQMNNGRWTKSVDLGASHGSTDWKVAGIGDFNGDGTGDILWVNGKTGSVDEWQMKIGNWAKSVDLGASHGSTDWKVAGIGDFNGDGTGDILWINGKTGAVDEWQMQNGNWARSFDLGATHGSTDWQVAGVGDFNRDGTCDIKWLNSKTGQADVWHMSGGLWAESVDAGVQSTDLTPAGVGDFNHDGTSDTLLLNASSGELYGHFLLT